MTDDPQQLAALIPRLERADWIALDTEADSLHAYPEKLCLIQVSLPGLDELIDPLASLDLSAVWERLRNRELILHGADYDLRLLRRTYGFVPDRIFDTMTAARLVGETEFGLIHLVAKYLGVQLEKGPQTANWGRRPLTERMAHYARNDTRYLQPLAACLRRQLSEKNRLGWLRESCDRLIQDSLQERPVDPEKVWRLKGSHRLDPRGLTVLRELWHWREQEARQADRPPYFILSHETLVAVAEAAVASESIDPLLPKRFAPRRRKGLNIAVDRALKLPRSQWPEKLRQMGRRATEAERRRADKLMAIRDRRAERLGIDPTLIANRATLMVLARDWNLHAAELMSWQRELLEENGGV